MAERASAATFTVGGKGAALSSSSVYAIANGFSSVRIDSSALDRLASGQSNSPLVAKYQIPHYEKLTLEENRAFLTAFLNKLLLVSSGSSIRAVLPTLISDALNSQSKAVNIEPVDVTEQERLVLDELSLPSALYGVCAFLDHESTALSMVVDVVAALSCEALGADVAAFGSIDSGDGFAAKEEVAVAGDMKVLLNGSKFVGKVKVKDVFKIPKLNGNLREAVKSVHSRTRIQLNSSVKLETFTTDGTTNTVGFTAVPLAEAIFNIGKSSLNCAKMNLNSIGSDSLRSLFEKEGLDGCSLTNLYKSAFAAHVEGDYVKFLHEVHVLLGAVWKIVAWEAAIAFFALEGVEFSSEIVNGGETSVDKKNEKKKKKKAVLGKGTAVIVQLIKDRIERKGVQVLDKSVEEMLSFFDPKDSDFDGLLTRVKELVESNESRRLPKLPKGTRDFAKEQMTIREKAFSVITEVFKRHGATSLDTPVFELRETLMGKYGEDSKLIYDLADQGGELCSLRYDLTVPFARYVAMNGLSSLKRYQIAKVYRRDNPSKGRYREFYQCDFDIAGQYERMGPDFEVIKILTELLNELDIGDYEIKLNHRKLLDGMLEICGVPPEKFRTICSSIDKLDKQSFEQVKKEIVEEKGLTVETADRIGTFVKERGSPLTLLSKLKQEGSQFLENSSAKLALDEMEILFEALQNSKCVDKVLFDLSLARGLDYYTGVIYEAVFKGETQVGSIAAGGRYDNLIGMFGTKQVPAVGISLGIERVFTIMEQLQKERNQTVRATETQVLVSKLGDNLPQAAELVSELWGAKIKAEYMVHKKVMKHIDRARESRIPWMVIEGEQERNEGIVKLKNLETTEEEKIPRSKLVEEIQRRLSL